MVLQRLLGEILIERGFISEEGLQSALEAQRDRLDTVALPEFLSRERVITESRSAVVKGEETRLGQILKEMGYVNESQLEEALRVQHIGIEPYDRLESRALGSIIEIGSHMNSSLNIVEVLGIIMDNVNQLTRSSASTLMLLDAESGELVFSVPTGPAALDLTDHRLPKGQGIAGWVAENGEPVMANNVQDDPRFFPGVDQASGFITKSVVCVPLKTRAQVIGVLEVMNKVDGSDFTEDDVMLLRIFAGHAAIAIENARLYGEVKTQMHEAIVHAVERKRAEDELRKTHESLENRVKQRTEQLKAENRELKRELESVNVQQTRLIESEHLAAEMDFAASVAEELRRPLDALAPYLQNDGRVSTSTRLPEAVKEILSGITDVADKLQLLGVEEHEESEEIDINELLESACSLAWYAFEAREIDIVQKFSSRIPKIAGAPNKLGQVFIHLINNAIEAVDAGGKITVSSYHRKGRVIAEIEDDGNGIPPDDVKRVFDPFYSTKPDRSLGVGLTIAKRITELHGGTLVFESVPGQQSIVTVNLPAAE